MKKFLLYLFLTIPFFAQAGATSGDEDFTPSPDATHMPAMVMFDEDEYTLEEAIAELESQGIVILHHRRNILLTFIPLATRQNLRRARGISKIEYGTPRTNRPMMKQAREFHNAALINEGLALPQPYDGKGVVVGICDIGFDTRHITFMDQSLEECRIRKVVQFKEDLGEWAAYSTPEEIYQWETDNAEDWHGTHVAGIAAGGYRANGYYGLAYEADIVLCASQLSDVGLLSGVEEIIRYARQEGKPAVINLSMGNYTGPHDGTSLFAQYLDYCAEDAVICISAGNEGNGAVSMSFDFTDAKKEVRVLPNNWDGFNLSGEVDIWSLDATPFGFAWYWHHDSRIAGNLNSYDTLNFLESESGEWRISSDPADKNYDETFASHFSSDGVVVATGGISPLNGRYNVNVQFYVNATENSGNSAWALYWPGVKVTADPGTHIDIFCGGDAFLRQERNFPGPDNSLCISDLATGHKTISVGMMCTTEAYGDEPGTVSRFSSYGTLHDGRVLPTTVAPGAWIASSISGAYLRENPEAIGDTHHSAEVNGATYYWQNDIGTSMSCPFVVGAIATWLQAYPTLSPEQVRSIVIETNRREGYPDADNPRHGDGWFEPYNGLQKVLDLASLSAGTVDMPEVSVKFINGGLHIGNPTCERLTVDIFTPAGMRVMTVSSGGSLDTIPLSELPGGIYIIRPSLPGRKLPALKAVV